MPTISEVHNALQVQQPQAFVRRTRAARRNIARKLRRHIAVAKIDPLNNLTYVEKRRATRAAGEPTPLPLWEARKAEIHRRLRARKAMLERLGKIKDKSSEEARQLAADIRQIDHVW
jgi:hypothetical protein